MDTATRLELFVGPMFSAKTERLIAELKRATYARKRIRVIKPARDTRTDAFIASRRVHEDGTTSVTDRFPADIVHSEEELRAILAARDFDVLAVDEAQFFPIDAAGDALGWFGRTLREFMREGHDTGIRILVAGLDMDFAENPFGPIPGLLAIADSVEKLKAVCMACGAYDAHLSQRLSADASQVSVGDAETYQARCRSCFVSPNAP